ncbi:MAG: hypothetical protein R2822_10805 [Spirosomataceae bacterium]
MLATAKRPINYFSKEYPSWGFEIANGANTIWERWNSFTPKAAFLQV